MLTISAFFIIIKKKYLGEIIMNFDNICIIPMGKGLFNYKFMVFDADDILRKLCARKNINLKIKSYFTNDEEPYVALFCKVSRFKMKDFLKLMEKVPNEMIVSGFTDYKDYFDNFYTRLKESSN